MGFDQHSQKSEKNHKMHKITHTHAHTYRLKDTCTFDRTNRSERKRRAYDGGKRARLKDQIYLRRSDTKRETFKATYVSRRETLITAHGTCLSRRERHS